MGVFDDDSDSADDDTPKQGGVGLLELNGEDGDDGIGKAEVRTGAAEADNDRGLGDGGGVDPLDAFMSGISSQAVLDAEESERKRREAVESSGILGSPGSADGGSAAVDSGCKEEPPHSRKRARPDWTEEPPDPIEEDPRMEIDPLPRVDHDSVPYESFERRFLDPTDTERGRKWRAEHGVQVNGSSRGAGIDPVLSFKELGSVASQFEEYMARASFVSPTPVQAQTLPTALSGRDCLVTASTGSGKTLAYALPLSVHCVAQRHIVPGTDGPIGIVLTPARELAAQVYKQCHRLLREAGGRAVCVAGGNRGTYELGKDLKRNGCEVIVSTPGRLIDIVRGRHTNFRRTTMIVLDEADRMLHMGFEKQVGSILQAVRPNRQTLMFSATMGRRMEEAARKWLRDPIRIAVGRSGTSSEHVTQKTRYFETREEKKRWLLRALPELVRTGRTIVFVESRVACEEIAAAIRSSHMAGGVRFDTLHGDRHQSDRNAALRSLRRGDISALVATDVAARGLDVEDVRVVVNFDCARNMDAHVHRIGRAGRLSAKKGEEAAHQKGVAYTLMMKQDKEIAFARILLMSLCRESRYVEEDHNFNLECLTKHRSIKNFDGSHTDLNL